MQAHLTKEECCSCRSQWEVSEGFRCALPSVNHDIKHVYQASAVAATSAVRDDRVPAQEARMKNKMGVVVVGAMLAGCTTQSPTTIPPQQSKISKMSPYRF
jgi:hypothetical protein